MLIAKWIIVAAFTIPNIADDGKIKTDNPHIYMRAHQNAFDSKKDCEDAVKEHAKPLLDEAIGIQFDGYTIGCFEVKLPKPTKPGAK